MGIKAICIQNEVTANTDYVFQVRLYSDVDDSAYAPDSATITYLKQDGTTILADQTMTISDTNLITDTLSASYIETPSIYNSAVITIVKSSETQTVTKLFHVVKQVITNPLLQQDIYNQYAIIEKHAPAAGYYTKIKESFDLVRSDLVDKYGMMYSIGMIDSAQIKQLVLLKTVELISQDFMMGNGLNDENQWYGMNTKVIEKYGAKLDSLALAYDRDIEDSTVDTQRSSAHMNAYR